MDWLFTFGITDLPPSSWKRTEPRWEDEQITATGQHSFHQLMNKLCETALGKRRRHDDNNDSSIDAHLWNLEISSEKRFWKRFDDDGSDEDDNDEDNNKDDIDLGTIMVMPKEEIKTYKDMNFDGEKLEYVSSDKKLSKQSLPSGYIIKVTYDYGTTTTLYLKVLSARRKVVENLLTYFDVEAVRATSKDTPEAQRKDIQSVPAYHWPKEKQIDAFYPNFSRAFLGYYVPLAKPDDDDETHDDETNRNRKVIGRVTLGLSARIQSQKDTVFASMETAHQDVMFAGMPFDNLNEFLIVAEQAWTPRPSKNDPEAKELQKYRYSAISRHLFPKHPDADEHYDYLERQSESEWAAYGPKNLRYRLTDENDDDCKQANKKNAATKFDFATAFPKTAAHFTSGKFRWLHYKAEILRVVVGRGIGSDHRDFLDGQVLRMWKNNNFQSLHKLLCAVEASWIYCNDVLEPETFLSYFDSDLGPSNPGPPEGTSLGKAKDAVVLSSTNQKQKLVTALALVDEEDRTVLYSGHDDGYLTKWHLPNNDTDTATEIWSQQIYPNDPEHDNFKYIFHVRETMGVAGIALRWDSKRNEHRVYTWTHAYTGYPGRSYRKRGPSELKCWSGSSGRLLQTYSCDVGPDEKSKPAHPSIATVVFCRLFIEDSSGWTGAWKDSIVVGLHCICPRTINWESDYSDFDIEAARENGEGNILPFDEASGEAMETWREHEGIIQAMAVIPDKYVLSLSMISGHGDPDAMILWDLHDPGVPLCRHNFWDPSRSLFKQCQTRLSGVSGISVSGTDVLFCCEYGDRIAVVTVEDKRGNPSLKLQGYGNIGNHQSESEGFHGRMAMDGIHTVIAGDYSDEAWIFPIQGIGKREELDRREGNSRLFRESDQDFEGEGEDSHYIYSGRILAEGKVCFPEWGGVGKERKKEISFPFGDSLMNDGLINDDSLSEDCPLGEGGPVSLAIRGKWLVAGFSNGTIARAPFLPASFHHTASISRHANCQASYSSLPSDEWNAPFLYCNMSDDSDSE